MLLAALLISALELQNIEFTNNHFGHLTSYKKEINLGIFRIHFSYRLSIVNTEDGHSIFTLNPAAPSDAGLYKVVARNPLGQVTATIRVVLGDISGSPDSPQVEAMTDTDILLSWRTPMQLNHTPVIAYKIQMGYIGK